MRSDKTAMMIELITNWIVTAFSSFNPNGNRPKWGQPFQAFKPSFFQASLYQIFLQPLKILFFFLPTCYLLSTIYFLFAFPPHFAPPASPNRTAYFPISHRPRPLTAPPASPLRPGDSATRTSPAGEQHS